MKHLYHRVMSFLWKPFSKPRHLGHLFLAVAARTNKSGERIAKCLKRVGGDQ
jgi:hypothetical protein